MFTKLEALFDSFLEMGVPGYECAILKDGQTVYRFCGGYSDIDKRIPMTTNERYNIYSCSKVITCVAAMQLYEKGLFKLEDRLCEYMPEFSEMTVQRKDGVIKAQNPILIKHLFNMTAGFSYNTDSPMLMLAKEQTGGKCPTRRTMEYLAKEPLMFEPGSYWNYSLCHDVLAALVEVISGERFGEYVKSHIFDPLNMTRSTFLLPESELDTLCEQYRFDKKEKRAVNVGKSISKYKLGALYESGGAGAVSTVDDYVKFLEAMRIGDIIIGKDTVDLMTKDCLDDMSRQYYWYTDYGYGLGVRTPVADKTYDFGWGGAAGAFLMIDRVHGISAYYSQHLLSSPNSQQRKTVLASTITDCVLGQDTAKSTSLGNVSEDTLSDYL